MLYFALSIVSLLIGNKKLRININEKSRVIKLFWIIGILLITFCALRSIDIGRDTRSVYYYSYQVCSDWSSIAEFYHGNDYCYYLFLSIFIKWLDFRSFMIACAIISIAPVLFIIDKYSENRGLSLALYVMFGYYTFCFSGMRQALAIGLCCIAYHFSNSKNLKGYILVMVIAVFTHFSALLFAPIYWVDKVPYKKITLVMIMVLSGILFALRGTLSSIAQNFVRVQESAGYVGSNRMIVFMVLTVILGVSFFKRNSFEVKGKGKTLLYTQIISSLIWIVATSFNNGWTRMYYYYHIYLILYIPFVIKQIKEKNLKYMIYVLLIAVGFYFSYSQTYDVFMMLTPYSIL